jgi:hypothetical protein
MAVSVSIDADRDYTNALKALAHKNKTTVAQLIRQAVDSKYGDQLKPYLDFFIAQRGDKSLHNGSGGNKTELTPEVA